MPNPRTPTPVDPVLEAAATAYLMLPEMENDPAPVFVSYRRMRVAIAAYEEAKRDAQPSDYAELKANLTDWSSGLITSGRSLCKDALAAITTLEARVADLQAQLATARAEERERCAKVCDTIQAEWSGRVTTALGQGRLGQDDATHYFSIKHGAKQCAQAIRALSDKKTRND